MTKTLLGEGAKASFVNLTLAKEATGDALKIFVFWRK